MKGLKVDWTRDLWMIQPIRIGCALQIVRNVQYAVKELS